MDKFNEYLANKKSGTTPQFNRVRRGARKLVYLWFIEYITWRGEESPGEGNTKCPFAKNVFFCENSVTCKLYMNARNALNLEEDLYADHRTTRVCARPD